MRQAPHAPPPPDTADIKTGTSLAELIPFLLGIAAVLVLLAMAFASRDDDALATCQLTHSFDVCHDALH